MQKFSQFFLWIITVFILGILIFYTFFLPKSESEKEFFLIPKEWKFSLLLKNWIYKEEEGEKSQFLLERISPLNEIFFSKESSYSVKKIWEKTEIELKKWDFSFSLYDFSSLPTIKWPWLNIQIKWKGKFFVHIGERNHSLVSENSLLHIIFTDEWGKQNYTDVFLFPHSFIHYDSLKTKYLKNADRIRVYSVSNLWYIENSFWWDTKIVGEKISSLGFSHNFIESDIAYTKQKQNDYQKQYEKITQEKWNFYFPWIYYINKYKNLFFNNTKKLSYYQKYFEKNLKTIFASKKYNTSLVKDTYAHLELIKSLHKESYEESSYLVYFYYKTLLLSYWWENIEAKKMYFDILDKLHNISSEDKNMSNIFSLLSYINTYDYVKKEDFYNNIYFFLNDYFANISLEKQFDKKEEKLYFDYFSFYIESILVSNFQLGNSYLEDIIKILWEYVEINKYTYGNGDETRKKTWIYINLELLKNIQAYLRGIFFELERIEGALLKMKEADTSLYLKNADELKKSVEVMKKFFVENEVLLDETNAKDKILIDEYEALMDLYEEYFLALEDYDKYVLTYDEFKRQLLSTKIYKTQENNTLSQESFIAYMNQFSQIDMTNMTLNIKENMYYEVKDIFIWWSNFSFSLYPSNDYEISNIIINGQKKSFSYKLNIIKEEWWEKNKKSENWENNFNNFFIYTFFTLEGKKVENFEKTIQTSSEDKVVRVFKSTKLLWEKWEFSTLSSFLNIPYNTLFVQQKAGKYNITLSWSILNISPQNFWVPDTLSAEVFSRYTMTEKEHYFSDMKLRFYKGNNYLLKWNLLTIIGKIDLASFAPKINLPLKDLKDVDFVCEAIERILWVEKIDIEYTLASARTVIKFDFWGNITNIFVAHWKVSAIMFGSKNILPKAVLVNEVGKYLDTLKK